MEVLKVLCFCRFLATFSHFKPNLASFGRFWPILADFSQGNAHNSVTVAKAGELTLKMTVFEGLEGDPLKRCLSPTRRA